MSSHDAVVFVVDDDSRVREALADLIASAGLDALLFESAGAFLGAARPDVPACLLLDLRLPDINGLDVQRVLRGSNAPPIVFISGRADVQSSVRAMKAGAIEFLSKPVGDEQLLCAIDAAITLDREARRKREEVARLHRNYERLTPREREVLPFIVAGFMNKETAHALGTSEITIGVHRAQIMKKMLARSLAELIRMADRLGVGPRDRAV